MVVSMDVERRSSYLAYLCYALQLLYVIDYLTQQQQTYLGLANSHIGILFVFCSHLICTSCINSLV